MKSKVREYLTECEVLAQLAEEASEVSQAALKLRRAIMKVNPTTVGEDEARRELVNEVSDCINCLEVLGLSYDIEENYGYRLIKLDRWVKRLEEEHGA